MSIHMFAVVIPHTIILAGPSAGIARFSAGPPVIGATRREFGPEQLRWGTMPDASGIKPEHVQLLIDLAILQSKLNPILDLADRYIAERKGILALFRLTDVDRKLIHELTGIALSTIYMHSGRPIQRNGEGEGS